MWAEIIFSRDDLARVLARVFPLTIQLSTPEAGHTLSLTDLRNVRLVPDVGLRFEVTAQVHWPLLGIDLPIDVRSLALLLLPTVESGDQGDQLVFRGKVEHAELKALPEVIEERITSALNAKLAGKDATLAWNFAETLTHAWPLPAVLEPLESFGLRPAWAKVRITEEGVVYAASFQATIVRRGEPTPEDVTPLPPHDEPSSSLGRHAAEERERSAADRIMAERIVAGSAFALVTGLVYLAARRSFV